MMVVTGLDRIARGDAVAFDRLRGKRVGLLSHPASVDRNLRDAYDVLLDAKVSVRVRFGPEHGVSGAAQDMISVTSAEESECPAYSLYGATEAELSPKPEWLADLDVVVIDLQDVGARYYTYVWTAALMLRAAAEAGVVTVVLDRPNPIGGDIVEGSPQRAGYRSFVGLYDCSVRHGMTIGEIARMVQRLESIDDEALFVVPIEGYRRTMSFADTGLPWILPSPNMPTVDTALVYPGGCLLEGTNLSEGRGTTRPFEIFGAPFVDGRALRDTVQVDGARLRPLVFQPTFHKHGMRECGGVQVHVTDAAAFRPYETYLRLIAAVHRQAPHAFSWRTDVYEFVSDRPAIDLLTGGPEYRQAIEAGDALEDLFARDRAQAQRFREQRQPFLLYA